MLSRLVVTVTAALALSVSSALKVGDYYRPAPNEASGVAGTTAAYRRSPCPALNTLANHGYLPRNGQNITSDVLTDALMSVYNMDIATSKILVNQVPSTFSLDYLGTHNRIEHDASLAHRDFYFGGDPMLVNMTLAEDLFARAGDDGKLGVAAVASARKDRANTCFASNPSCSFDLNRARTAFLEASVLLLVLGDGTSISVEHAKSFILEEKFPGDWEKPRIPVTVVQVLATSSTLTTLSLL